MKFNSLHLRITVSVTIIQLLAIAIFLFGSLKECKEVLLDSQDQIISGIAQDIQNLLDLPKNQLNDAINRMVKDSTVNRYEQVSSKKPILFIVWQDNQKDNIAISQTDNQTFNYWLDQFKLPAKKTKKQHYETTLKQDDYVYRFTCYASTTLPDVNIVVGINNRDVEHETGEIINFMLILGTIMIGITFVVTGVIVPRLLTPIDTTSQALKKVSLNNMSADLLKEMQIPTELHVFVDSVKNMLSRLDRAIIQQKQFSADASHELRTPLAVAKSTLQTAQIRERTNQEYQAAIAESLEDISRMEKLIEQLMALAHLDNIEIKTATTEIKLNAILSQVAQQINNCHNTDQVKINDMPDISLRGYEDELYRMFYNIIDNALLYGPEGHPVTISTKKTDKQTAVIFHDSGYISAEYLDHLCERFYRVDKARSRNTGGSGLGLAIAQKIAERHNAHIEITSIPDTGTDVTVTFSC
ncbi:MAG: hypothetical protein JEZ07_00110 [Phycisphaerae bacterium]|nr:hypothetical protein [Phycisphaerae bacterium]